MFRAFSLANEEKRLLSPALEELSQRSAHSWPESAPLWIDLHDPTPEEEAAVFEHFLHIHPLSREDLTKPRRELGSPAHFPKVGEFRDYLLVIVNPLPPKREGSQWYKVGHRPQLGAVLTRSVLITQHYTELPAIEQVIHYIQRHHDCAGRGPDYLFHLILDALIDEYSPVVEKLTEQLDRMERGLFRNPTPKMLTRLLRLKRQVSFLRKTLILEREVLARLTRGEFELIDEREIAYYRNVYDHLVRFTELVESAREMVSDLMQTHLAATSNKLNEIMKVLTMISTVVLPMTLIAGVYGMNFEYMPELQLTWGYPLALSMMGLSALTSLSIFRWKQWI